MTKIDASTEGKRRYESNSRVISNPYTPGSSEYNDYERGWVQALKRSGNYSPVGYSEHKITKTSTSKAAIDPLTSERYRHRK